MLTCNIRWSTWQTYQHCREHVQVLCTSSHAASMAVLLLLLSILLLLLAAEVKLVHINVNM